VNLNSLLIDAGDLRGALEAARAGVAHNERLRTSRGSGGFVFGNLAEAQFLLGGWDEAEEIARAELERARLTGGLYYEPFFQFLLAELGLVREGRVAAAAAAAIDSIELARQRADAQTVTPGFALSAWLLVRTGRPREADALLDELLALRRSVKGATAAGYWAPFAALVLERLGRQGELTALDERPGSEFLVASLALDGGRFADAAATFASIGAPQLEAEALLLAARDGIEPERSLRRARELLSGLGAAAQLRELDALSAS
jgi:hypothetical protein